MKKEIILISTILSLFLTGCNITDNKSNKEKINADFSLPVKQMIIKNEKVLNEKEYSANLLPFEEVTVRARVNGILESKLFKEGDIVQKNQKLYTIEKEIYQNKYNTAEISFNKNLKNFIRAEKLYKSNSISEEDFDNLKFEFETKKLELENAKINLNYTEIYSPIKGYIKKDNLDVGNLVGTNESNSQLVNIVNNEKLFAEINIPQSDYLKFKNQINDSSLTFNLYSDKENINNGKVVYISPVIDKETDTILIKVLFENKENLILPGEFVKVRIGNIDMGNVKLIPENSIVSNSISDFVYVINEKYIAELKPVKTGELIKNGITILEGLNTDDKIVISNLGKMRPNTKVIAINKEGK